MKKILILTLSLLTINLVSKAQVELTSTSVGATYYVTVPGTFVLTPGLQVTFKANVDNSASMSLDVSGTGAKPIRKLGGSQPLSGSDILSNQIVTVAYDGSNWQMLSAVGSTPAASNDWTLTGNAISAGNQLGTTNAFDLSIIAGGTTAITIDDVSQNIGIGVAPSTFYKIYTNIPNSNTTSYTANEIQHNYSGASTKTGVSSIVSADGSGLKRAFYGFASAFGTQQTDGFYSMIDNDGSGDAHGVYNDFSLSTGSGAQEGIRSIISNAGTSFKRGVFNALNQTGSANGTDMTGVHNSLTSTSTISQDMFGMISQINNSSPTGSSYGIYQLFSGTSTGTQYGIYSSGEDLNYFSGSMNIGGAFLPGGIAGAAGQVLTSSGGGVNTWSTPAASVNIYNSNGSLTAARTVTQGANTLAFTATSVNAFSIDGSTFSVDAANNNVGIGTSAPSVSSKLHVVGAGNGSTVNIEDNTLSNGSLLYLSSTSTLGTGGNSSRAISINRSGTNSNASHTAYGVQSIVSNTGASSTNMAGYFSANGGSSNYALYAVGNATGTSDGTGTFSTVGGSGSGTTYGVYGQNSSSSTGATYAGNFENFNSTGSIIYGVRSNLTGNAGGSVTKYGIRSDVIGTASSNVGGYFRAVGGTTNHALQLVDGTEANNRVLASDAAGNATWTDLTALSSGSTAWTRATPNIYPTTLTDNVIIGATSGSGKLTVYGSNDPLLLLDGPVGAQTPLVFATAGANKWAWYLPSGGADLTLWHYGAPAQNYINFNGSNGHVSIVPTAGNVGIGTTTPVNKLDVEGSLAIGATYSGTNTAPANGLIVEGNTGFGTPTPSYKVHTLLTSGYTAIEATSSSAYGMRFISPDRNWYFLLSGGGTTAGSFGIYDGTASSYRMYIDPSNGNVGMGTTSPTQKLEVVGSVEIPAANDYTYSTAKTNYSSISPVAFIPESSTFYRNFAAGYCNLSGGTYPSTGEIHAAVNLPNGAVITEVRFYIYDNDATYDFVYLQIFRYTMATGASSFSSVAPPTGTFALSSYAATPNWTVDNSLYQYNIRIGMPQNTANTRLYGVRITYTVTNAD